VSYGSFFSLWSWFEVFKETPAGELIEANCHARLNCSKQLLNDVIIWFSDKKLFATPKNNRMTDCCNKERQHRSKTLSSHTERRWQTTCRNSNWATPVSYSFNWEPMSMKPITVTCFRHNSCCLLFVMSLASLYFRKQCHNIRLYGTLFSDINISQGSVATPLRYGGLCNEL